MAALLAVMSSLMWGTSDFLGGFLSRRLAPLAVYGISQVMAFAALALIATVRGSWGADPRYWPWAIAASMLGLVGMLCFYRALAIGPMGIVSPLVALSVLVPVAVSLLRGETPPPVQILGIILALVGILLASGPELSGAESARPLILAGVATVCFGGMFVFMAEGSRYDTVMTMTGMRVTSAVIFAVVFLVVRNLGGATRSDIIPLIAIAGFDAAANITYGFATTMGLLSTVAVLGDLYPVVTAILAALFLRERLQPVQYAGVAVALSGVALISVGG